VTAEMLRSLRCHGWIYRRWTGRPWCSAAPKKEAPAQGGWNVFHTWSTAFDTMTPAVSSVLGGAARRRGSAGDQRAIEKLRAQFTRELDAGKRKAIAEEVQQIAYDEVLYVPWGQFVCGRVPQERPRPARVRRHAPLEYFPV